MELAGRMDPAAVKLVRFSAKRVLYGSQGWDGHGAEEEEVLSLRSEKTGGGVGASAADARAEGRFSRKRRGVASSPKGEEAASSKSVQ